MTTAGMFHFRPRTVYIATEPTHVHVLVSWTAPERWQTVRDRIKNIASLMLGRGMKQSGRHWFVRKSSRKQVREQRHFDHLANTYLPRHSGLKWREGDVPPEKPSCLP